MFLFEEDFWQTHKERFVTSYETICPTVREVGYEEMLDHRFLTEDRDVQQTVFSNGTVITVNFGDSPYEMPDGAVVDAMGYSIGKSENMKCVDWISH
jgi:hypothetical protein